MSKEEMLEHNKRVISDVMTTLIEMGEADPIRMLNDRQYVAEMVSTYINAANLARSMMNMPPLVLYNLETN